LDRSEVLDLNIATPDREKGERRSEKVLYDEFPRHQAASSLKSSPHPCPVETAEGYLREHTRIVIPASRQSRAIHTYG
jgi:hypothetical protein